ncbi:DPP IV N-terminal domain-containing protein [candidate division KSB1 bacterium]
MKKLAFISLFFLISSVFQINAQDKLLKIDDPYTNPNVYPKQLRSLQWMGQSYNFTYLHKNKIVKGSAKSTKRDTILRIEQVNDVLKKNEITELRRFPTLNWETQKLFSFTNDHKILLYNIRDHSIQIKNSYNENAELTEVHPKTFAVAYTIENNLYISVDGKEIQITSDLDKGIVNGSDYIHRQEFGIHKGIFWSPKGNYVAFYRKDETMVTDYPLVDVSQRIATLDNIKYPMAGMKSEEVTMGIFNLTTGKTVFMKTGEPAEQYLTAVTWGPDEKFFYIALLNRDQNHLKLNKYEVATGNYIKTLFEEKNIRYVEPEKELYFMKTMPNQFIWFSERDGYDHLYLYDTDGKLINQLTKGNWVVTEFLGFDSKEQKAFFVATKESPIQKHIYSVDLKTNLITKISQGHGTHNGNFCFDFKYLIDNYSSTDITNEYLLLQNTGKKIQTLLENYDPLKDYKLGEMTIGTLKSDDQTDLYYRMIKPVDFDPNKKYPVFLYVYGGPHLQMVTDSWLGGANYFQYYMAQEGFIMFTLDNRGSENRGFEFESSIHRNLGDLEVSDQMKGVKFLKSLPYVDTTRIGVDGWSYGGFLSLSLMLKNPGVFKIATAGGPVVDWKYYEVMYGERYMDTPEDNPEGYEKANLLNYVKDLDGKVLIFHGTNDPVVVWQHSLQFLKESVKQGKLIDYFVYPGHEHNIMGHDRLHLYRKKEQYFKENL